MANNNSEDPSTEFLDPQEWAETFVAERPIISLAIALVIGAIVARWMFRSSPSAEEDAEQHSPNLRRALDNY